MENWAKKIVLAVSGTVLTSFGMAFNAASGLGNDPVAVFYDGIRRFAKFSSGQLGVAVNIINYSLMLAVFLLDRKYINIGTFLYTLPMGSFVDWGTLFYRSLGFPHALPWRILTSCCGCLLLYLGISIFISLEIGVDPLTGIILIVKDHARIPYRVIKVLFDAAALAAGILLGGTFGAVTVVSALIAGPLIQLFSERHKRGLLRWLKVV